MLRDADLISHLPPFMQEYRELQEVTKVENPEFQLIFDESERIKNNQFIVSSDEKGIAKFESFLKIYPNPNDSLERRRAVVLTKWNDVIPYTIRYLRNLLDSLVGNDKYIIDFQATLFELEVAIEADTASVYKDVRNMLEEIVPMNIDLSSTISLIQESLNILTGVYAFNVFYKRTNKFGTASIPGSGRLNVQLELKSNIYIFPVNFRRTNKFRTSSVPGDVAEDIDSTLQSDFYAFNTRFPITGKFVARSE